MMSSYFMEKKMAYENIVGLQVTNDEEYTNYREAMMPILSEYGGGFRYDFKVSEVLKNEEGREINRVFAIYFKDKENMEAFFSNPRYLEAKNKFFEKSVAATTIISGYDR